MVIESYQSLNYNYTKDTGLIETEKINRCSMIHTFGITYNKVLLDVKLKSYNVFYFAGTSFEEVIEAIKEKIENENLETVISFSIYDKNMADWYSQTWKLGYGGVIHTSDTVTYNKDLFYKEIDIALKKIKENECNYS